MAVDYKKLLVSYIDKIVFVLFLIFFLVSAFRVVMSGPSRGTSVPSMSSKSFRSPEELYEERYVLNSLRNPNEPDATLDFTSDPEKIAPALGEKQCPQCGWIVPRRAPRCANCGYSWTGEVGVEEPKEEGPPKPLPKGVPFRVLEITRKPVDILFKGFFDNPWTYHLDLQINWGKNTKTSIVPLGETFHGYRLFPLDRRMVEVNDPKLGRHKEKRFFLKIRKPGEEPLIVEKGKIVRENEAMAIVDTGQGRWDITHRDEKIGSGESYFEVYAQYQLKEVGGEGREYEVGEVRDTEILLRDLRDPDRTETIIKFETKRKKLSSAK